MKKFYLGLLFTLLIKEVICQNQKIDSLWTVYNNKEQPDTNRLLAIHIIASSYTSNNPDTAIILARQELALAKAANHKRFAANALNIIGGAFIAKSNYPEAIESLLNSLRIFEEIGNKKGASRCFLNLGAVYFRQQSYDKASDYFLKALPLAEEFNNKQLIAECYNNLGVVYFSKLNYPQALAYYLKDLKINQEIGNKNGMGRSLSNISTVYIKQTKPDYSQALNYAFKALQVRKEVDDKQGIVICYINIGSLDINLSNYKGAIQYSDSARKLAKEIGDIENERLAYENLALANSKMGNYKEAYEYHVKFKQLTDSIFNADNSKQISDLKTKFEVEKKESELKVIQQEEIKRQKLINWSVIILSSLVLLSSLLLLNRIRLKQKNKHQQLLNEKQKELAVAVMDTQEQERKRIAEDLHDSLGHLLSTVKLNLQTLPESQKKSVQNSMNLLNQASEELQNITFNLMPRTLEEEGLVPALNELAAKVSNSGTVKIQVHVHNMNHFNLEKQSQFNIYRIVQEAVNNILKHAEAKEITIQLIGQDTHFTIMIEDDGKGFDTEAQKTGRGLKNIVTRSLWLKGNINIDSTPGRGTTITTEIPV
ncbi:MAG TPA: sensor histidine kinase [Bacteroidia bacterium]|nr:sensor histidine kinase [Bacteroidia bacterium]